MDHSAQAAIEAAAKAAEPPPGEGQNKKIWIIMFLPEIIMIQISGGFTFACGGATLRQNQNPKEMPA